MRVGLTESLIQALTVQARPGGSQAAGALISADLGCYCWKTVTVHWAVAGPSVGLPAY